MRKYIIFILFLCVIKINGQIEKYFPLHVGDERQYYRHTMMYYEILYEKIVELNQPDSNTSIYKVEKTSNLNSVIKYYYYKIDKKDPNTLFYSEEYSNPQNFYPLYKLIAKPGDEWQHSPYNYIWITFAYYTTVLPTLWGVVDSSANYYKSRMEYGAPVDYSLLSVMKGFGLIREYIFEVEMTNLTGCKLNGIKYGDFVDVEDVNIPNKFNLEIKNYPNPFNGQTIIEYSIPNEGHVEINIFNVLGEKIITSVNEIKSSGKHNFVWNANGVSSGIYFAVLNFNNTKASQKIILQK